MLLFCVFIPGAHGIPIGRDDIEADLTPDEHYYCGLMAGLFGFTQDMEYDSLHVLLTYVLAFIGRIAVAVDMSVSDVLLRLLAILDGTNQLPLGATSTWQGGGPPDEDEPSDDEGPGPYDQDEVVDGYLQLVEQGQDQGSSDYHAMHPPGNTIDLATLSDEALHELVDSMDDPADAQDANIPAPIDATHVPNHGSRGARLTSYFEGSITDLCDSESSDSSGPDLDVHLAALQPTIRAGGAAPVRNNMLPMPRLLMLVTCLATFVDVAVGVTCHTCFDQISGCLGGDQCPLHTRPHTNTLVIAGAAGVISLVSMLPVKFLRECKRSALDCLKMVSNRPLLGTPIDITAPAMTVDQLVTAVQSGAAAAGDAMRECMTRLAHANSQLETNRLNALCTLLSHLDKASTTVGNGVKTVVLGSYSLAWGLAGKVVRQSVSTCVSGITTDDGPSMSATPASQLITMSVTRPRSMAEFSDMLTCWHMICHATGLCNILVLGEFTRDVVHDSMSRHGQTWQVAHELLLIYLEAVETTSDSSLHIRNVFTSGSQDTFMRRAVEAAKLEFGSKADSADKPSKVKGAQNETPKWNGNFTRSASRTCISYNLGTAHPARSLDDKGTCKHNHKCDHWVSDKGPHGTCGGDHPRSRCDNPAKCDKPQK